ncbi:hypothetical protein J5X84_15285 [Streptosporangiaceae bacterium NEAU-GS5]|nr:hypothetical protein [Streptosporangiaceae bacterium NEAU-GS5]
MSGVADWESAPSLIDGAMTAELTAADCGVAYWLGAVPQGTLRGHVYGHGPEAVTPAFMREPGPLNEALTQELAFRSIAEDKATRALGHLVALAPDTASMEFYATQLIDEARHAMVFRTHMEELTRTPPDVSADREKILVPLEEFGLRALRDRRDFIGGVIILTVLVEGVLAPAAELSERKWRPLDPAAADVERGAGIDEIRHLVVGSSIAREHLLARPDERPRLLELIEDGHRLWATLPTQDMVYRRELLFQEGLRAHAGLVGDYEIWPGRRLADTTPEERLETALEWSGRMQRTRLDYMGLSSGGTT